MVFNAPITGIENEIEFVNYLDRKKINEVHPIFQQLLERLFPNFSNSEMIKAWKNKSPQKTDIYIQIKHIKKELV